MTLSALIKTYRAEHGMTISEFARRADMSASQIYYIESGKNSRYRPTTRPTINAIEKCARAMNRSFEDVYREIGGEMPDLGALSDEETMIIEAYRKSKALTRQAVKDVLHIK